MFNSFDHIRNKRETTFASITDLCLDRSNNQSFINSDIKMINFDKLAKEIGPVIHSPDALGFTNENIHFIEFKNIKWKNLDIQDCLAKFYQGLSSFAYHSEDFITKNINITYTIICSPNKNLINADNNPLGKVFN